MQTEHINILSLKDYYQIKSVKTNNIYIHEDNSCFLFYKKSDAESFCSQVPNTEIINASSLTPSLYVANMYVLGIETIRIYDNGKYTDIPTEPPKLQAQLYNHVAKRNLLLLKQTSKKKYLRNLAENHFFCPAFVEPRHFGDVNNVRYAYATNTKTNEKYFLLFSDIDSFNTWSETQEIEWKPLKVSISKFNKIRRNHAILINPLSNKIIIDNTQFKIITEAYNELQRKEVANKFKNEINSKND